MINLLDASKVSIGTVMEIAWTFAHRIPTVIIDNEESLHDHGMLTASVGWRATTLDEGIEMIKNILLP